ncbi:MAG: glycosyltransferase family 2 protein [Parcubacteria group bacterium]|nr:MAG: glycosyltransferase family 2 protein [Parcubacteria group bacterium]
MNEKLPLVSIIIPCRNEEKFIQKCLDSLIDQDYPKEKLEILVIDGSSEDGTKEIVAEFVGKNKLIKLLENPKKFTPVGLNIGIKEAKGEIIVRMDAHARYEKDYVSQCLKYLKECKADNVGGAIKTLPSKDDVWAKAIAIVLSHPFGVGNSFFRIGTKKTRWVDTVFGGCYRKEIFEKIGFYNERLTRSQDIELNQRLRKSGGKILLAPDIKVNYYPQSNFTEFFKHNFSDGLWTIYPLKFGIKIFSWRHLVPLFFTLTLIILAELSFVSENYLFLLLSIILIYFLTALLFSFFIALKEKNIGLLFALPFTFANRHSGYGLGSCWGIIRIML